MPVLNSLAALKQEMTEWRRDFHAYPELAFHERRTSDTIAEKLQSWGIEVHRGLAGTGVVGVLRAGSGHRSIGLRADMDALPMEEQTGLGHMSTVPGVMHGCGHDGHMSMLLGAARYLSETKGFDGTVTFIFQPAEEGHGGGRVMVEEGLFDRFPCDEVYALHNWPDLPLGTIGVQPGPMMAATATFDLTLTGTGGHAAMPHLGVDPVVLAAQVISAWQTLVSRSIDPADSAVVSVTRVQSGSAYNVIPETAVLSGTVRTFDKSVQARIAEGMARIADGLAAAAGARAALDFRNGYPATLNTPEQAAKAVVTAADIVGPDNVRTSLKPSMGGEDFAYMLEQRPGAYIWVGQGTGPDSVHVHNPHYDFNDEILPVGASLLARLVESELKRGNE